MEYDWDTLQAEVKACEACGLCRTRTNTVLGEGSPNARIMFVGEGPGQREDETGRPFVGPAGMLLDKMLLSIDLTRQNDAYICNIVKCRPPANRAPQPSEAEACMGFLRAQFALVRPQIVVCLGATAAKYLIDPDMRITRDRGQWTNKSGVWMTATYHPAALLRDAAKKADVWEDLLAIRAKLREPDAQG